MSIYKVYSRTCRSSRPVQKITEEKLKEEIEGIIFDDFMNECDTSFLNDEEGEISDESFNLLASALCELLESVWNKDGILERGDYAIIKAEESPSRSCMYGRTYTDFTQKEIIEKMEELKSAEKEERSAMKFLAYINDDDGERVALLSENELIKMEDESDFTGIWFKKIFDVTDSDNIKEIRYRGWQPNCLIEFVDNDNNVVLRGYGTDH